MHANKLPNKHLKAIKLILFAFLIIYLFNSLMNVITKMRPSPLPNPTVIIQKPTKQAMTEYVTQTGTLVAYNSVDLVARIEGYLEQIDFVDGSIVKKKQPLFVIEPEPYLDKLKEAQATVAADKADYEYSKIEYSRQQRMYKQNATSLNNVQEWETKVLQSQAEVEKAVANERNAAINYSYTHVLSPFDGRIGRHLVDIGNLVGNGVATDLATVEQIDPIYVYFNLNEIDLLKLRKAAHKKDISPEEMSKIPVYVSLQTDNNFSHQGKLNFVNTGLNASTGTMEFRALLPNKDYVLLPGLFVQVRIPLSEPKIQLTVPKIAIQYDQIGAYIYVVDKNKLVVAKRVITGPSDENTIAIVKGLAAEDDVIVNGIQNATPGHIVTTKQAEKPRGC